MTSGTSCVVFEYNVLKFNDSSDTGTKIVLCENVSTPHTVTNSYYSIPGILTISVSEMMFYSVQKGRIAICL